MGSFALKGPLVPTFGYVRIPILIMEREQKLCENIPKGNSICRNESSNQYLVTINTGLMTSSSRTTPAARIGDGLPQSIGLVLPIQWTSSLKNIN